MDMQSDIDRMLFFEHARMTAETTYAQNPLDSENLTRWGGALLELSQFQTIPDAKKMILESVTKLEEALTITPTKHDTIWCLGNGHTSYGFLVPDKEEAQEHFDKAGVYFKQAVEEDPSNEIYRKSLEVTKQAPGIHEQIHSNQGGPGLGGPSAAPSSTQTSKKKKNSDLKYDILGWVILAVGIVTWVGLAKSHLPPSPAS